MCDRTDTPIDGKCRKQRALRAQYSIVVLVGSRGRVRFDRLPEAHPSENDGQFLQTAGPCRANRADADAELLGDQRVVRLTLAGKQGLQEVLALAAKALEFTILTAARVSEAVNSRWNEIDVEGRTWTVPASRMKAGREHVVLHKLSRVAEG